uniref:Odorant receptor n=1 Tax=Culicoides sonorensis TaxID=179676 RepID=A0A336LT13_CULSO
MTDVEKIIKLIKSLLIGLSLNVFVDYKNQTVLYKIYRLLSFVIVILLYVVGFYNDFISSLLNRETKGIIPSFFTGNNVIAVTTLVSRAILLMIKRRQFLKLMNWLKDTYEPESNEWERKYKKDYMEQVGINNLKEWKYMLFFILSMITFTPTAEIILHAINPSFEFLLSSQIVGITKDSKYYFILNITSHAFGFAMIYSYIFIDFMMFVTISRHILAQLKIINDMCKDIGKYEKNLVEQYFGRHYHNTTELKLMGLNKDILVSKHQQYPKSMVLLKLILERHKKLLSIIKIASDFYFLSILLYEALTFVCNGFVYCTLTILNGSWFLALTSTFVLPQYYVISSIGTEILESGNEMSTNLYNSDWLYLSPKERKMMQICMVLSQKPHTLTAGGFQDVSLQRFTYVMSFSYRCCLLISFLDKKGQSG